jgi:hypothetical protein
MDSIRNQLDKALTRANFDRKYGFIGFEVVDKKLYIGESDTDLGSIIGNKIDTGCEINNDYFIQEGVEQSIDKLHYTLSSIIDSYEW